MALDLSLRALSLRLDLSLEEIATPHPEAPNDSSRGLPQPLWRFAGHKALSYKFIFLTG